MTHRRVAVALLVLVGLVAAGVVVGVRFLATTPQERYCSEVVDRRAELTEVLSGDSGDVLLRALPVFEDLRSRAPEDIAPQWRRVVSALEGLQTALEEAGADPATYDRDDPPADVTPEERDSIDAAARRVGSQATRDALAGLDQQSRDVCGTPLTQ